MSYEGTDHIICENGHWASHGHFEGAEDRTCCHCGGNPVAVFYQDQTNGEDPEIPSTCHPMMTPFLIEPERIEKCSLGFIHVITPARFRVPDNGLWQKLEEP